MARIDPSQSTQQKFKTELTPPARTTNTNPMMLSSPVLKAVRLNAELRTGSRASMMSSHSIGGTSHARSVRIAGPSVSLGVFVDICSLYGRSCPQISTVVGRGRFRSTGQPSDSQRTHARTHRARRAGSSSRRLVPPRRRRTRPRRRRSAGRQRSRRSTRLSHRRRS